MSHAWRTCQFINAVVYTTLDTAAVVSQLVYTTTACLPHAPRLGKVGTGGCWHGLRLYGSYRAGRTSRYSRRYVFASCTGPYITAYFRRYTIGKNLTCTACAQGKRVSPGVLASLGDMMASMKSLENANAHLLILCPDEVPAANKQRWCTQAYKYHRFCNGIHCAKEYVSTYLLKCWPVWARR